MKTFVFILLIGLIFIMGCAKSDVHAAQEKIDDCFTEHADDSYEEKLEHCQEEICGEDSHCFEEVEEMSEDYR